MDDQRRCQFCGFYYTPPELPRVPSEACDACYLKIAERLSSEPDGSASGTPSGTGTPTQNPFEMLKRFNELLERSNDLSWRHQAVKQ